MDNINKIAQMFLVGISKKEDIPNVINLIKKYNIGGVVLYKNNYSSYEEYQKLINDLYDANKNNKYPLFIATDQEGGRVNRLPKEFVNIPSGSKMSTLNNKDIKSTYNNLSKLLHDLGINMDLFPILDVRNFNPKHAIGDRAFSHDINRINEISDMIIPDFKNNKVVPVIKHFPGQGGCKIDSHIFPPFLSKMPVEDLKAFKNAIDNGADSLLVGHIIIKGYTGMYPASISKKFINNEIRTNLKYDGLVITDEIGMRSVAIFYGKKRSTKKAIYAGNDMICCKYKNNYPENIFIKLAKDLDKGKLNVDKSIDRIINIKKKYNIKDIAHFNDIDVDKYNDNVNKIKGLLN